MTTTSRRGLQFAKRIYPARIIGLGLGFFCVASVFYQAGTHPLAWALLVFNGYIWPHLAYWRSRRSHDAYRTEIQNLVVDSLLGGFWVPLMSFNLLPSAVIIIMLSMDNIAAGGLRMFFKGLLAHLVGAAVGIALVGVSLQLHSSLFNILSCLPFMAIYPLVIGIITYRIAHQLRDQKKIFERLSRTDGLTGLYNRVYWEERATEEFWRSRRNGTPVVLILLDIDYFKTVNDEYGHAAGDDVLRGIAALLQDNMRHVDIVGRYGGEEFAIVLPGLDHRGAHQLAERLREMTAAATLSADYPRCRCTISVGVAPLTHQVDYTQWVGSADRALYAAKQRGRNQIVFAEAVDPLPQVDSLSVASLH